MTTFIMFLVCLIASGIGSVAGCGGGVIIKPVLDALHILPVSSISFLSGCTVLSMAVVSLIRSKGNGIHLRIRTTGPMSVGAVIGGILGKWLLDMVKSRADETVLGLIQAILLLLATVFVLIYTLKKNHFPSYRLHNVVACLAVGLILGVVSAFLGIGGGPLNVAFLFFFFSMEVKEAAKNSIFIILFSQAASLISALSTKSVPEFLWYQLLLMVAGGIGGALLGNRLAKRMNNKAVERLLMGLMIVIIAINVYNVISYGM